MSRSVKLFKIDFRLDHLILVYREQGVQLIVGGKESAVVQIEMVVDHSAAVVLTLSLSGGSIAVSFIRQMGTHFPALVTAH